MNAGAQEMTGRMAEEREPKTRTAIWREEWKLDGKKGEGKVFGARDDRGKRGGAGGEGGGNADVCVLLQLLLKRFCC